MANLQFTAKHVRELLALSRTELQRWLDSLPPFDRSPTKARTARHFTLDDLAFLSVVAQIHRELGLALSSIACFSQPLHEYVSRPSAPRTSEARVFINLGLDGRWRTSPEAEGHISLAVDPAPVWSSVYKFLGVEPPAQPDLPFGLMSIPQPTIQESARERRTR